MSKKTLAASLLTVLLGVAIAPAFASQTAVPSSLDDVVRSCTIVAVVDVADARIVERTGPGGPIKFVEVRATIVRSIKGSLVPAHGIAFLDRMNEFSQDKPLEMFVANSRYVVSLNWNSALGETVLVSHEAIFAIENEHVRPVGRSALARAQAGRSSAALEQDLRDAVARERPARRGPASRASLTSDCLLTAPTRAQNCRVSPA